MDSKQKMLSDMHLQQQGMDEKINKYAIVGWGIISSVLIFAYVGEAIKGVKSFSYLIVFTMILVVPYVLAFVMYKVKFKQEKLQYVVVIGYSISYVFVLLTCDLPITYAFILPMYTLIILYHNRRLVFLAGMIALVFNIVMIFRQYLAGVITVENTNQYETQMACLILCTLTSYFSTSLYESYVKKNVQYTQQIQKDAETEQDILMKAITTIANTIDAKDTYTNGHSIRVAEYAGKLAKELGLSESEVDNIQKVALLHDIGKIGVPDSILNKPGKLTKEEYEIIKKHPEYGAKILQDIDYIDDLAIGALHHHERYDGKGYPMGLRGEDIPYIARIICVADTFDAMNSNRVYRKKLDKDYIIRELEKNKCAQFDPVVAEAMIHLIQEGEIQI